MTEHKFRVAICGGGIGGLCLAVALSRYSDIEVHVFEAAERFREIGAGVMIWSKTWRVLELLGLAQEFSTIAHAAPDGSTGVGFEYRRSDRPEGFHFHTVEVPHGCIRFHRAHFLDVFVRHLPQGVAHFGKRLLSYTQESSQALITLNFSDNSSATCNVLIGCDGVKSLVRKQMFFSIGDQGHPELLDHVDPFWSGTVAYRGLIPENRVPKKGDQPHRSLETPMMYCGISKHVVTYSISQGSVVNVVALASQPKKEGTSYEGPWVIDCTQQELLDCYSGWEPEVVELLKCVEKPTKWAIHQLKPLPIYVTDRVALLGDAAHAMVPHQGAGAGQAIEDAYVLAELLGNALTTLDTVPCALKAYEQVRLPLANHVLQGSRESGMMYEFNGPQEENYEILGPAIQKQWDWVWASQPDDDSRKGLEWMKEQLRFDGNA